MKLIQSLTFTLFLAPAIPLLAAEENAAENSAAVSNNAGDTNARFDPAAQRQADLAREQDAETEVIWLKLNNQKQLALLQKAASASPAGTILIFPDRETGADWPSIVHPLRTQMTKFGWHTLSLTLPEHPVAAIPERTLPVLQERSQIIQTTTASTVKTPESTAINTSGEKEASTYSKQITELGQLASDQLANLDGKLTVILGIGEGAAWAMHYFAQDENRENRFLVLLDPTQPMDKSAPNLIEMISATKTPILDLWFNSNQYKQLQAELRKRTARRNGNNDYQQILLNQRSNDSRREPLWLTRQLRGILKTRIIDRQTTEVSEKPNVEPMELTPGS